MGCGEEHRKNNKRERAKNYLEEEKQTVVELAAEYSHILENRRTDGVTSKEKETAWASITRRFNGTSKTGIRSVQQLKLLYNNLKKSAKKKQADEKVESYKTGGGTNPQRNTFSTSEHMIINILGPTIEPHNNPFDSNRTEQEFTEELFELDAAGTHPNSFAGDIIEDNIVQNSFQRDPVPQENASRYELSSEEDVAGPSTARKSPPVKQKVENFFSNIKRGQRTKRKRREDMEENYFNFKKEKHEKEMEILEIIKKKESLDLKIKEIEYTILLQKQMHN